MLPIENNRNLPAERPLYFDDFITMNKWNSAQEELPMQLSPMPATNVYETVHAFYVELIVPGLNKDDLQFFTTETSLEIRYEPDDRAFEAYGSRQYLHREFRPIAFRREFELNPDALDFEAMQVNSANGIVLIEIPKQENYRGALPLREPFSLN